MPGVLRLIGIAISIGLADSLNPSTIGPALYLAAGERPRETVSKFTLGVFVVYLLGGLLIAAGPGQTAALADPEAEPPGPPAARGHGRRRDARRRRDPVAPPQPPRRARTPDPRPGSHSSALLGAGISAVELPTAFPYFFAIAAIIGSGQTLRKQIFLIVLSTSASCCRLSR